jgi:hypothetical protein
MHGRPLLIISINTQSCYIYNTGIARELADSGGQLDWLEWQLKKAEKEEIPVWIVGHVPPSYKDCLKKWSVRYFALIERY